jgi:hypothetical protein
MKRIALGPILAAFSAVIALGCAGWGGPRVPSDLRRGEGVGRRLDDAERLEAYRELFPMRSPVYAEKGRMRLTGFGISGEKSVEMSYYARDAENLRMLARVGEESLLDTVRRGEMLTVIVHRKGAVYQEAVAGDASPLAATLGWEPADLYPVLMLGRTLAEQATGRDRSAGGFEVYAEAAPDGRSADGLRWVRLDARSGMPAEARWSRGGRGLTAVYRQWERYDDKEGLNPMGVDWVLPNRIDVRWEDASGVLRAAAEIVIDAYRFDEQDGDSIFKPVMPYRLRPRPMEQIGESLP